jgi:hypothetical protein
MVDRGVGAEDFALGRDGDFCWAGWADGKRGWGPRANFQPSRTGQGGWAQIILSFNQSIIQYIPIFQLGNYYILSGCT